MRKVLVTGSAGFIGYHLCEALLARGDQVTGYDALTDYYDVSLKQARHERLERYDDFVAHVARLEDMDRLAKVTERAQPDVIIHLAAQAGVRFSLENPRSYVDSNVTGSFNVLEAARSANVDHLLMASTSSVYGAARQMPFIETQMTDHPMTIYAATKKASEAMAHSWAHLYDIPITMFRFFTVYGPWGRPDMALFKFTKAILEGKPIDIYNHGEMYRDFTYVDDLVAGIVSLIDAVPPSPRSNAPTIPGDSLSPDAPWRVVNIGNSHKEKLLDFVEAVEAAIGKPAIRNYMDMQPGDVPVTWADAGLLQSLTGKRPETDMREGVARFVRWYRDYYGV
ncbi:SDR family NAD(P)-dependent oxidoreductase [Qingshengfaniella alkalisoli]|uniref:SDR family NAD(P)-dependent oxidoreductase n=1 Tax=Qingshengfaniella alkalisoli TaxID=2599296 RepID=A0A5B8IBI0_9RHOB|nr:SDR family NAD(P)-dependent oxidoreductase [Qingshengfaniella alkalisoli]QDY71569.1 SDR family NAD(P)-dependent oxidoreductase [Qingshengfaniella alkalisoli]